MTFPNFQIYPPFSMAEPTITTTFTATTPDPLLEKIFHEIRQERNRQVKEEGFTPDMDDSGQPGRLAAASTCYGMHAAVSLATGENMEGLPEWWPFDLSWWKPKNARSSLVKALALMVAELEAVDRAVAREEFSRKASAVENPAPSPSIRDPEEYL